MASVIRARVVSPSGVLQISNSTLAAAELLRLYAVGSSGTVEFDGNVKLSGNRIDIAGNTVRVKSEWNGQDWSQHNGLCDRSQLQQGWQRHDSVTTRVQKNFGARPRFDGN